MTARRTYLDWNATAPLCDPAREAMIAALALAGNPSSVHAEGRAARNTIEDAREKVAALLGARASDVVFTSGATEANATVFAGNWDTVYLCDAEHDSVLAAAKGGRAHRIVEIPVDRDGCAQVEVIADHVLCGSEPIGRGLVSLHLANNETGVVQCVAETAAFARSHGLCSHTDAVQAPGRIAINVETLGVDYLTISAHKMGGPKGVGALVLRDGAPLPALLMGGGQERRRRAGTENIAGIAGFGAAAVAALVNLGEIEAVRARRDRMEAEMRARVPGLVVVGGDSPRLANTSCMAFGGKAAETLVIKYDLAGVAISAGSACSSGKVGTSHVLRAMGIPPEMARGAIRVSLGPTTTDDDIAAFIAASETILRSAALAA
jgi:cysteine desulfurase